MDFVLRIFFSGLIAFLPDADGKEVTVILVDAPHEYHTSTATVMAPHKPLLLARAGSCEGDCPRRDAGVANFLFADKPAEQAADALEVALLHGGAWQLSQSELHVCGPQEPLAIQDHARHANGNGELQKVPTTAAEREDISWIADLGDLAPSTGGLTGQLRAQHPPARVAARLRLRTGKLFTYSLIKIDGKAKPIHFRPMTGQANDSPYAQALAGWVAAEIHVPGESVEIVDENWSDGTRRRMKLHPENGLVEVAVLNLPPFEVPENDDPHTPEAGEHFEIYYDLANTPPSQASRPVPHATPLPAVAETEVNWDPLHPDVALASPLLSRIRLNPRGKGPYDRVLCPVIKD